MRDLLIVFVSMISIWLVFFSIAFMCEIHYNNKSYKDAFKLAFNFSKIILIFVAATITPIFIIVGCLYFWGLV